jgi:hypothetical protein
VIATLRDTGATRVAHDAAVTPRHRQENPVSVLTTDTVPSSRRAPAPHRPPASPQVAAGLVRHGRRPTAWPLADATVVVRGARPSDLAAVAAMHGRCSPGTLLQRYSAGGRGPSLDHLVGLLRSPLTLVVEGGAGVVALGSAAHPGEDDFRSEISLLVEDTWQGCGIGSNLAVRLGSTLRALGYAQAWTTSATPTVPLHRVMEKLGPVRALARVPRHVVAARLTVPSLLQDGDDLVLG